MMSVLGPRSPQLKYFHRRDAHVFRETADGHDVLSSSIRKDTDEVPGSIGASIVAATVLTGLAGVNAAAREKKFDPMQRGAKLVASGCLPTGRDGQHLARRPRRGHGRARRWAATQHRVRFLRHPETGAPFGLAWYQGDIETDDNGEGHGRFIGRFNEETFIVAQAPPVPAPLVHNNAFPDASINPVTDPLHTFHLGLWFNSSKDAKNAGCPADTTPSTGSTMPGSRF